jgi:hypothetical protein
MDQGTEGARPRPFTAYIRLDAGNPSWGRAAALLESLGGQQSATAGGPVFRFAGRPTRDDALESVRHEYGWTIATPFDQLAWTRRSEIVAPSSPHAAAR